MSPSSSSATNNAQSPGLKTYFKTPEGRYKLHYEKTHPAGLLHYGHGKTVTQVLFFRVFFNTLFFSAAFGSWEKGWLEMEISENLDYWIFFSLFETPEYEIVTQGSVIQEIRIRNLVLFSFLSGQTGCFFINLWNHGWSILGNSRDQVTLAHLKDKPVSASPPAPPSSYSTGGGVRSAAARFLGGSNGSRALSFVGGNGGSKSVSGNGRIGSIGVSSLSNPTGTSNFDGKGTYLIFNVGDAIFICDLNTQDKVIWCFLAAVLINNSCLALELDFERFVF